MTYRTPKSMADCSRALDAGTLLMQRPWGDWVKCRWRSRKASAQRFNGALPIFMENEVEAAITAKLGGLGFPGVRIAV